MVESKRRTRQGQDVYKRQLQSYVEGLALAREQLGKIAVTGGSSYVLPYASRLSDIPDKDSRYFVNDESVPFFQMVVHGYIDYLSLIHICTSPCCRWHRS